MTHRTSRASWIRPPSPTSPPAPIDSPPSSARAYVTIGAGTRAAGDETTDGEGLAATERFGNGDAGRRLPTADRRTRPGRSGRPRHRTHRRRQRQPALRGPPRRVGRRARPTLGYGRSVVANGDGTQPDAASSAPPVYFRSAVGALMGSFGRVPRGTVGRQLLRARRLGAVRRALRQPRRRTCLPRRVDGPVGERSSRPPTSSAPIGTSSLATTAGNQRLRRDAIRSTDRLFGEAPPRTSTRHV